MKKRYLGLLGLPMVMAQCQPACTPIEDETPVEVTVPVETTQPPATTQPPTTTQPPVNANPYNIRFDGFACDEYQTMSGWSAMLAVQIRSDIFLGDDAIVAFEMQDGTLTSAPLDDLNPGEQNPMGWAGWPRIQGAVFPSVEFFTFRPTTRVQVSYLGVVVLAQTFTFDDVRREEPACAAVIDTPGVPG